MIDPIPSIRFLDDLLTRYKGMKRMLLLELKKNLSTIDFLEKNVPFETIIGKLKITQLEKALESNFDFNSYSLIKHKVSKKTAGKSSFNQRYIGWTTEQLFNSIYLKIDNLQTLISITPQPEHIDKKARLMNIYRQINLLLLHLNK
jgi:hypothetical protein